MSKIASIADARSRKLGTIGAIGTKATPKTVAAKEVAEKPKGKVKVAETKAPEKTVVAKVADKAPAKKMATVKAEPKKIEIKAAPKKAEAKTETVKVPAKREVAASPKVKSLVLELVFDKAMKNSVVYKNDDGQSIYFKHEYMKDAKNPPKMLRMTVEEVH